MLLSADSTDVFFNHMSYVRFASWNRSSSWTCDQTWSWFNSSLLPRGTVAIRAWALQMLWITWGQFDSILLLLPCPRSHTASQPRLSQVQPKLHGHGLRLTGACGKERTGFPQAGGPCLSEIPHPVDPEIWKRCYTFKLR